jgi:hypothetical protein
MYGIPLHIEQIGGGEGTAIVEIESLVGALPVIGDHTILVDIFDHVG